MKESLPLHYKSYGKGQPVILLYGLFGSVKNFTPLIHQLQNRYQLIVPLFPFFENGLQADIFHLTDFLEEVAEELNLSRFHLLGNSMGGHIAILYTASHPGKVQSLILSGSSGLYEKSLGDTYPRRGDYAYIKEKAGQTFFRSEVADKEMVDEIYNTVNSRKALHIVSLAKSTIRNNVEHLLPTIQTPACIIWGRNDTITPPEVACNFSRLLPNAELHWIDKCGHVPMLEHPGIFGRILDGFLSKQIS